MKVCYVIGSNSDIAHALIPKLENEYRIVRWARYQSMDIVPWDLAVITLGQVAPVGNWHEISANKFEMAFFSNVGLPFRLLQGIWPKHNPGARICFFAGANPNTILPGYVAYNTAKMALLKLVEQLDAETPDAAFFALAPGIVNTKIHNATREAEWPNPKLEHAIKHGLFTRMEDIYRTLMWCVAQTKEVVGGRNICVSDIPNINTEYLARKLAHDPDVWKLRRREYNPFDGLG